MRKFPVDKRSESIERRASLRAHNTFGLPAVAASLVRMRSEADVRRVVDHPEWGPAPSSCWAAAATWCSRATWPRWC
jgi:hypothetical protein